MDRSLLLRLFAIFALLTIAISCDPEEEEEDTREYMEGGVSYYVPAYVHRNQTLKLTASGITNPTKGVIYKWLIPALYEDTLTAPTIIVTFPDSLYTLTVTGIATCTEYYNSSSSRTVTVVDTTREGSLKGLTYGNSIVDERDGKRYYITTIGDLDWFAENLAYNGAGVSFNNSPATNTLFGKFYNWEEATGGVSAKGLGCGPQGVCPKGWSVPTNEDWADLGSALKGKLIPFVDNWEGLGQMVTVNATFNGDRLWPYSPDNALENKYGWNALPIGNSQLKNQAFRGSNEYAFWWSSTEKNSTQAYYRYIYYDRTSFPMNYTAKDDFGANIRCVRLAKTK